MEDFAKIFEQLGLGAIGIILLLWAAGQSKAHYESQIASMKVIYDARITDMKESHATHLKLLGKVIGLKGDSE